MKKGIYTITLDQLTELMQLDHDGLRVARLSTQLFAGYYNDELVCSMGLIPPTLLSNEAYLWLLTTEAVKDHRLVFGLNAHKFIKKILTLYPTIVGHCEKWSCAWLEHLGATVYVYNPQEGGLLPFRITR